ncbi:hypothetical protein GSI_12273 [Ganoderma sinense ZZ0214-1]|uniref:Peptidase S53 domain-containing protein n=1 Tax=Ganoderma sinense ZZ0214-1 TaxID=1077348 RepID=A0A2G8RYD4_9APHY|nr:hypothetical protein GSI_12273 [Ganoderma sinense ZZ0214-1]
MARTKQSARHSTGDVAPRSSLGMEPLDMWKLSRKPQKRKVATKPRDDDEYTPTSSTKRKRSCGAAVCDGDAPLAKKRSNPPRGVATASTPSLSSSAMFADDRSVSASPELLGDDHQSAGPAQSVSHPVSDSTTLHGASSQSALESTVIDVDSLLEDEQREIPEEDDASDSEEEDLEREDEPWEAELYATPPTVLPPLLDPLTVADVSNSFCYLCQNGGSNLRCSECPRIVCLKHVPQIALVPEAVRDKLHFRCPSCHVRGTRSQPGRSPYLGLYHLDAQGRVSRPYIEDAWVSVAVEAARPQHAQVNTLPIIIMSIRLVGLDEGSCPARFLYNYLLPWFDGPAKTYLRYIDIPFSIRNLSQAERYRAKWRDVFAALGPITNARLFLVIYTHSHDKTGDLFFATKKCSSSMPDWWVHVIPAELTAIARAPSNELTIAVLACGAVVNRLRPRDELKKLAAATGALRMFSFGATCLQAVLTVPFFMNYALRVFLEGMALTHRSIVTVFDQSLFLARHTPIWIFWRNSVDAEFSIDKYDWTHPTMRPHGHDIGLQCPGCGSLSSREGVLTDNNVILVVCKKDGCRWSKAFEPPRNVGVRMLKLGAHGRAFPDVATQGVQFAINVAGQFHGVDGTSASSPTFAAIVSLLNDARLNKGQAPLGFLNPLLYSQGAAATATDSASGSTDSATATDSSAATATDSSAATATEIS